MKIAPCGQNQTALEHFLKLVPALFAVPLAVAARLVSVAVPLLVSGSAVRDAARETAVLTEILKTRAADEWEQFLQARHVPAARVRTMGEAVADPQTASRAVKEYLATLDDAAFGAASEVMPKFI